MKKRYTLTEAIQAIESKFNRIVLGIEFEDGSMRKFNVRLQGNQCKVFINMDEVEDGYYHSYKNDPQVSRLRSILGV